MSWGAGSADTKTEASVLADLKAVELPMPVISKQLGKPVKLMWARTDSFRQGRSHPMVISRVRAQHAAGNVVAFDQRHTSVATDFTQGLGELLSATAAVPPEANYLEYSAAIFLLTASVPYNLGVATQLLNEVYQYNTFNTSSVRNIYSPEMRTAGELIVDSWPGHSARTPTSSATTSSATTGCARCSTGPPRRDSGAGR